MWVSGIITSDCPGKSHLYNLTPKSYRRNQVEDYAAGQEEAADIEVVGFDHQNGSCVCVCVCVCVYVCVCVCV